VIVFDYFVHYNEFNLLRLRFQLAVRSLDNYSQLLGKTIESWMGEGLLNTGNFIMVLCLWQVLSDQYPALR